MRIVLGLLAVALAVPATAQADVTGAVGGIRDPATGFLDLTVVASDRSGAGLRSARASLGGEPLAAGALGAPGCVPDSFAADGCPATGEAHLWLDTTEVDDGPQRLEVTVEDGRGAVTHLVDQIVTVANTPPVWTSSVTIQVGSGTADPGRSPTGPSGDPSRPGAAGCRSPRLSVSLATRPVRYRRGVPVLRKGRRYTFKGRLTCVVDGRRRPAARGTALELRQIAQGRTVGRRTLNVGRDGRLHVTLAARDRRALVFRLRAAGGRLVRVRIPVRVVARPRMRAVAAGAQGGVSVSPASIERTARAGASATATVRNTTRFTLEVTVTPRPWRQAKSGAVSPNRRRKLAGVAVSARRFSLAPGAARTVRVTLRRVPRTGSRFGALDVVGKPTVKRRGINVNYRLVGRLRFNPAAKRYRLAAGGASVRRRTLGLLVRNAGNTVDPVTGSVRISGPGGGRSGGISAVSILPGGLVRVPVAGVRGLREGTYTAAISLSQGGRERLTTRTRFRIR